MQGKAQVEGGLASLRLANLDLPVVLVHDRLHHGQACPTTCASAARTTSSKIEPREGAQVLQQGGRVFDPLLAARKDRLQVFERVGEPVGGADCEAV